MTVKIPVRRVITERVSPKGETYVIGNASMKKRVGLETVLK